MKYPEHLRAAVPLPDQPERARGMTRAFADEMEKRYWLELYGPCEHHPSSGRYPSGQCIECTDRRWRDLLASLMED